MRNFTFDRIFAVVVFMVTVCTGLKAQTNGRDTVTVFDAVRFYDGYLVEKNPEDPTLDGILRHRTSLYAIKLTDEQLAQIGDSLEMHVRGAGLLRQL